MTSDSGLSRLVMIRQAPADQDVLLDLSRNYVGSEDTFLRKLRALQAIVRTRASLVLTFREGAWLSVRIWSSPLFAIKQIASCAIRAGFIQLIIKI